MASAKDTGSYKERSIGCKVVKLYLFDEAVALGVVRKDFA